MSQLLEDRTASAITLFYSEFPICKFAGGTLHAETYWRDTSEEVRERRPAVEKLILAKFQPGPQSSCEEFWRGKDSSELSQIEARGTCFLFWPRSVI